MTSPAACCGPAAAWSASSPRRRPGKPDFARRNRIIAGMSEAIVVVEAPDKSGALLTADAAIGYGRELFAVPARWTSPHAGRTG